jgi:sec-independent protein translocase protein TatB
MLNIGFSEAVIIFLVALIVLGPEKLPELGKFLGKLTLELKKGIEEIKRELEIEEIEEEIKEEIKETKKEIEELKEDSTEIFKNPLKSDEKNTLS